MSIDKATVEKIANLSKLELSENEKNSMTKQLDKIVHFFEKINELNTDNIEPTAHVLDQKNIMREDETKKSPATHEEILILAPLREENFIVVPKVIE